MDEYIEYLQILNKLIENFIFEFWINTNKYKSLGRAKKYKPKIRKIKEETGQISYILPILSFVLIRINK